MRDVAARRPGPITHVGLGTFVDPREKGGRLNARTKGDVAHVVQLGGKELLWYQVGSTADCDGHAERQVAVGRFTQRFLVLTMRVGACANV